MKRIYTLLIFIFLSILITSLNAQETSRFQYRSPLPDSKLLSRETNIIFSGADLIDQSSLTGNNIIKVIGSESGVHAGKLILSDDNKTVVFNPYKPFTAGETVSVTLNSGIKTLSGKGMEPESYSFSITPLEKPIRLDPIKRLGLGLTSEDLKSQISGLKKTTLSPIPPDFPVVTVGTSDNPSSGNIFLTNFGGSDTIGFYISMVDNEGNPIKYKKIEPNPAFDFTVQPNGLLSYADVKEFFGGHGSGQFKILDTSFAVVDSFQCGNGYDAELHGFQLLPNGHGLLFAYDPQPYDLSKVVPGGNPNAIVTGGIIQEVDANKNVVFQWRTWDYIPLTDSYANLTSNYNFAIDYVHINAIEGDNDGNILFIGRTISAVIKINRSTGEIMWHLGGKENEFTFINEHPENAPEYFVGPHDIRRIANGNITLFDNGDRHNPPYSRAVEYKLNEDSLTATLVWEYRHNPDIYTFAMGSVQRLPNGSTFIGWGSASAGGGPVLTEVRPDNTVALEFFYPQGVMSYRAFKFPWASGLPSASVMINEVLQDNTYTFNNSTDTTGTTIKFNYLESFLYNAIRVIRYEFAPQFPSFEGRAPQVFPARITVEPFSVDSSNLDIWFKLDQIPGLSDPENITIYHRTNIGSGIFTPLSTAYLPGTNELKVSGVGGTNKVGEFIFAYTDVPVVTTIPGLVSPLNNQLVNQDDSLKLEWSPTGFADKFYLQVSTDQNFTSIVVDDSNLTSITYILNSLLQEQDYFWHVKSKNLAGWGDWSDNWQFKSTSAFIDLTFPNGSETWETDTSLVIYWDFNTTDSVNIDLYKNDAFYKTIVDSFYSTTGGYRWTLPDSIPSGTDYKIKISSIDNSIEDMSENNFTIINTSTDVERTNALITDFKLGQNYPNPFNPITNIEFNVADFGLVSLKVYNVLGKEITTLVNEEKPAGSYVVSFDASNFPSGVYFYTLKAGSFSQTRKMLLLK
jgi:hypothetical protein